MPTQYTKEGYPYDTPDTLEDSNNPLMKPQELDALFAKKEEPRYQLFPERMARHIGHVLKQLIEMPTKEVGRAYRGEPGLLSSLGVRREDWTDEPEPRSLAGQKNTGPVSAHPVDPYLEPIQEGLTAMLGMGRPVGALAGIPKETLGTFVGQGSAIWDPAAAETARVAARMGAHPDTVFRETGYTAHSPQHPDAGFADKMQRTEVPDIGSKVTDKLRTLAPGNTFTLAELLSHPELYKAEPRLAGLRVEGKELGPGVQGQYNPINKTLQLSPSAIAKLSPDELHALVLHEVSHAAEDLYGFARGGSPEHYLPQDFPQRKAAVQGVMEKLQKAAQPALDSVLSRHPEIDAKSLEGHKILAELAAKLPAAKSNLEALQSIAPDKTAFLSDALAHPTIAQYFKHLHDNVVPMKQQEAKAYAEYQKLAGEENARLAEKRMFMTPEELRHLALWHMFDTPATKQRVAFDLQPRPSQSVKAPENMADTGNTSIAAAPGADVARLARLLGSSLYGDPGKMTTVTVKELLQNSFDAVKGAIERDGMKKGKINITADPNKRLVHVEDNGKGMTPEVMADQFLKIAGTVKETDNPSGGLGIAKMLYAFGNDKMSVTSMRDGKVSTLETSGPELMAAMGDPAKAPRIYTRDATEADKKLFPDEHGTHVSIKIPEKYKDTSTGEERSIEFSTYRGDHPVLEKSPLFHDIDVQFNGRDLNIGSKFPKDKYTQFANANFDWGKAKIYITKDTDPGAKYGHNMNILSEGIFQFSAKLGKNPREMYGDNIPYTLYVDAKPRGKPDEPGYPFALNRQQFTQGAKKDFEKIFNYISVLHQQTDFANAAKSFGDISYLEKTPNGAITRTTPQKLEPKVPETETPASRIRQGDQVSVENGQLIVNGKKIPELTSKELDAAQINLDELKIDQSKIDPNKVILHDNIEIKMPDGNYKSLVKAAREKFGDRFDKYVHEIGDTFRQLRDTLADEMNYPDLKKEAIGVSLDQEYYGVSTRVPFSGSFINPAIARFNNPIEAGVGMVGTMIHEIAHHKVRSHNAEFPAEMQSLQIKLDRREVEDMLTKGEMIKNMEAIDMGALHGRGQSLSAIKKKMADHLEEYQDVYRYLSDAVGSGDARPRGRRFKDEGSGYERRIASAPERMAAERPQGARAVPKGTGTDVAPAVRESSPLSQSLRKNPLLGQ